MDYHLASWGGGGVNSYKSTKVSYFLSILVGLQPSQFNLLQGLIILYRMFVISKFMAHISLSQFNLGKILNLATKN